jgi:arylsulfatase A-like enzyme
MIYRRMPPWRSKRSHFGIGVKATLAGLLLLLACRAEDRQTSGTHPPATPAATDTARASCRQCNLVVVSIDTLRADHLSSYGYARETSPHLDAFAEKSVVFTNAISVSRKTAPSHMSLFTSLYPTVHQVYMDRFAGPGQPSLYRLDEKSPTLAEILTAHGFKAVAWHGGGHVSSAYGFDRGFSIYADFDSYRDHDDEDPQTARDSEWRPAYEWLRQEQGERFFLFLHTFATHDPYMPPEPYYSMFGPGEIAPVPFTPRMSFQYWSQVSPDDPGNLRQLVDLYDGAIRFTDERLLKPLFEILEEKNLMEDTIVVILSDHGEEFREHGAFLHDQLYDEILRVPFVLYLPPGLAKDQYPRPRIDAQISTIDLLPTLLELLKVPYDAARLQGRSLVPLLFDGQVRERPAYAVAVVGSWERQEIHFDSALRWQGLKLIRASGAQELYDLTSDPAESLDLSATDPDELSRLANLLVRLEQSHAEFRQQGHYQAERADYPGATIEQLRALGYVD